ncbi:MAG: hypothetical protein IJ587_02035, partial [Synergistaceae bacterium]|nr:hypothetical protein [Synergistaceae bacterium]
MEFIFTSDGFYIDDTGNKDKIWYPRFTENKFKALYDLGFEVAPTSSASFTFMKLIADRFVEFLISMPELELTQGNLTIKIPCESLL